MPKAFTLMEMIIVIVIIGILATLSVTHYGGHREKTYDREAQANLQLIIAAERIRQMEVGSYYASATIANLNTNLSLMLSTDASRIWDYLATAGGASACCAQATRNGYDNRNWRMRITEANPVSGSACP